MATVENNCTSVEASLDAYYDKELDSTESQVVQGHIAQCESCTAKLTSIEQVATALKSTPRLALDAKFDEHLDELIEKDKKKVLVFGPKVVIPISIAAAVALVVIGLNGEFFGNSHPQVADKFDQPPVIKHESSSQSVQIAQLDNQRTSATQLGAKQHNSSATNSEVVTGNKQRSNHQSTKASNETLISKNRTVQQTTQQHSSVYYESDSDELAGITGTNALTEAVGIATDEDGLYDLKM